MANVSIVVNEKIEHLRTTLLALLFEVIFLLLSACYQKMSNEVLLVILRKRYLVNSFLECSARLTVSRSCK